MSDSSSKPGDQGDTEEQSGSGSELDPDGEFVSGQIADDQSPPGVRGRVEVSASFSGPLPPPAALEGYERAVPGLAREIVDQWKAETAHRHQTIDGLRGTDHEAMIAFYRGERLGQILATLVFAGVLVVAILAIILKSSEIGIAAVVTGGGSAIWAMRRRSDSRDDPPTDLGNGDAVEGTDEASSSHSD